MWLNSQNKLVKGHDEDLELEANLLDQNVNELEF